MARKKSKKGERSKPTLRRFSGVFHAASGGFGFVTDAESGEECFIPRKYAGNALDGDAVECEEVREERDSWSDRRPQSPVARVRAVVRRARETIVGRLDTRHSVIPLDRHLPESIRVNDAPRNAKKGDWVRLRLLSDGSRHTEKIRGAADLSYGPAGTVSGDLAAIAAEYGLQPAYAEAEEKAALRLKQKDVPREDLTGHFTITIDPASAHDFDDAISLAPGGRPTECVLGVHIADVATWIQPGTKFDKEAAARAFSSYIPGMFRPMLPKPLTAKISMREGELSSAHSVLFTVRKRDGRILSVRRVHSTVRVDRRLDFETVQAFLDAPKRPPEGWSADLAKLISALAALTRKMRKNREDAERFLSIETAEVRAVCEEGSEDVTGIVRKEQAEADRIVEECMLAANSAVASELIERRLPGLFRIHPEPDPERLEEFSFFVKDAFRISTGDLSSGREACMDFLKKIPDDHRKPIILGRFLRALPRATYSPNPELHFGLGKTRYSHFTSPIRRYADLAVHQQLLAADLNARLRSKKTMEAIAADCTEKEERVDDAFHAANDRLKLHYLKQNGALENHTMYEAVIQKVSSAGLVCEIPELGLMGSVRAENLRSGGYRRGRGMALKSDRSHTDYRIGDFIYLTVDAIDLTRGNAYFRPIV